MKKIIIRLLFAGSFILTCLSCSNSSDSKPGPQNNQVAVDLFSRIGSDSLNTNVIYGLWGGTLARQNDINIDARFNFSTDQLIMAVRCQFFQNGQIIKVLYAAVSSRAVIDESSIRILQSQHNEVSDGDKRCSADFDQANTANYSLTKYVNKLSLGDPGNELILNKISN